MLGVDEVRLFGASEGTFATHHPPIPFVITHHHPSLNTYYPIIPFITTHHLTPITHHSPPITR
ncbi:MAG: hypothetical protein ACTTKM_09600 [Prevotella fusca]